MEVRLSKEKIMAMPAEKREGFVHQLQDVMTNDVFEDVSLEMMRIELDAIKEKFEVKQND